MKPKLKRSTVALLGVCLVAASALPMLPAWLRHAPEPSAPAMAGADVSPSEIIVDLRDDATPDDVRDLETRFGVDLEANSMEAANDKVMRAAVPSGQSEGTLLDALRADGRVEAAEPEIRFGLPEANLEQASSEQNGSNVGALAARSDKPGFRPNDARYNEQWNFAMVGAEQAWERARGRGVVVAIIDTGVAAKDSPRGKQARDFGQTSFTAGYDFVHDDDDPYDDHAHGTHVAGTVAESTNNHEGVAGLAFEATIMPLKVLTAEGFGSSADIADAIRWAADHGANVINMSLGSPYASDVIHKAVKYARRKGVVIVCAAGNGFGEPVGYPAAFPECIAVSSVGPGGKIAFYSSYGPQVALAAPGGDMSAGESGGILQNTVWAKSDEDERGRGDDYYFFQGTSMASPHVAAVAALLESQGVHDPQRVRDILRRSAVKQKDELRYGAGILSADRATALVGRMRWHAFLKKVAFVVIAVFFLLSRLPSGLRWGAIGALWLGAFGPDFLAGWVGADSAWNLAGFSALAPFLLFFEWEDRRRSKIVAAFALGVALCLLGAWLAPGQMPFTETTFGESSHPWIVSNLAATLVLAALAWWRSRSWLQ